LQDTPLNEASPGVLVNDSDVDGDAIFAESHDASSWYGGTVAMNEDGSFT
jgi:hypothetical protein